MAETERDALFQALDALEALQIPYMVVGSFASTFWGRPRMTHDADLVVELPLAKVTELALLLAPHFYAPAFVIEDAVRKRGQFNLIHLDCAFKIDLWLRKTRPTLRQLLSAACWASYSAARFGSAARRT